MKKLLIILLIIPVLSNGQTLQGYSGRYFRATQYFDAPIYKLNGVTKTFSQWTTSSSDIYFSTGKVGIGNTSPQQPLHVTGITPLRLSRTGYDSYDFGIATNGVIDQIIIKPVSTSTNLLVIGSDDKIGINTTFATKTLDINGSINATSYYLNGVAKNFSQWVSSSNDIYYNSGKVGIGTTNPSAALTVDGNKILFNLSEETKHAFRIYDAANANPIFDISGNDDKLIEIDSAGVGYKVGIGKIPTAILDVNGGVKIANDADAASAVKVGTMRYRVSGNNSYFEMCMQTGASTYAWVVIKTNTW